MELRKKYLNYKGEVVEVIERDPINFPNFFYDKNNCLYAFADPSTDLDENDVCGIAPLALPDWPFFRRINDACAPHDFAYSSQVYQAFNLRSTAEAMLKRHLELAEAPILAEVFTEIAHEFGAAAWENDKTRDK